MTDSITCPTCSKTSYSEGDIQNRYCGYCHKFHDDMKCPYQVRPELTRIPERMKTLPIDPRGYPIPFFVGSLDGVRDFRVTEAKSVVACIKKDLCWVCGQKLFREKVFVIGPMCSINRISSEPPSHRECAVWSAVNCPFLARPYAKRRPDGMPEWDQGTHGAISLRRNPGVTLVWYTRSFRMMKLPKGILWQVGEPFRWEWYAMGKTATRAQVVESIDSGYPLLLEQAAKDGPDAILELVRLRAISLRYIPTR